MGILVPTVPHTPPTPSPRQNPTTHSVALRHRQAPDETSRTTDSLDHDTLSRRGVLAAAGTNAAWLGAGDLPAVWCAKSSSFRALDRTEPLGNSDS
eukprot:4454005-Prymnesium_polylepis.1